MTIVNLETKSIESQSHRTENWMGEGWAIVPQELEGKLMGLYPFMLLTVENGIVTSVVADVEARNASLPAITPADQRREAYTTFSCIPWEGATITVDAANLLWLAYSAECSGKADDLSKAIEAAKDGIRARYPDKITGV